MKNRLLKKAVIASAPFLLSALFLGGCGSAGQGAAPNQDTAGSTAGQTQESDSGESEAQESEEIQSSSELKVTFGDSGDTFIMNLYDDNETAAAIAGYVGSSGWRLPIYEYDDEVNYDVMQYYDIPSRYDIPSNPQQITAAKAGEVYYSDPNRVILFYADAEITGEYTLIGYFDPTEEFIAAVKDNPVLEGWENKIIRIEQ